jgi:hypothetical protein
MVHLDTQDTVRKADMITPRYSTSSLFYDGRVYIFCGSSNGDFAEIGLSEVYDVEHDTWTALETCPVASYSVNATELMDMIYIVGFRFVNVLKFDPV